MSDDRQVSRFEALEGREGLALVGELDCESVPVLVAAFSAQNGQSEVTLDLSRLEFIDSSGMHAIVKFARARETVGTVTVTGASPFLLRLFEITQLTQIPNLLIRERA
jgi:anti-anti-sigma factor